MISDNAPLNKKLNTPQACLNDADKQQAKGLLHIPFCLHGNKAIKNAFTHK